MYSTVMVRLLGIVLLASVLCGTNAWGQSRPTISWMRGEINARVNRGPQQIILSPDNQFVATCVGDGTAKIRRVSDGMLLRTLVDTPDYPAAGFLGSTIESIAYTPDGTKMATGSTPAVRLWDLSSGALLHTMNTPNGVNAIAMSPDGTKLAVATGITILVLNVGDFSVAATLTGHSASVTSLAFSPDGQKLATGSSDDTIRIWKVSTWATLQTLFATNAVQLVAFSHDNSTVCSYDYSGMLRIWNATTGAQLRSVVLDFGLNSLAISPDGLNVFAAEEGPNPTLVKLNLWRISDGALITSIPTGLVWAVYSSDGTKIYGMDHQSQVSIRAGADLTLIGMQPAEHYGSVAAVAVDPAGALVATASHDGSAKLWDAATGVLLRPLSQPSDLSPKVSIAFSPNSATVAVGDADASGATTALFRVSDGTLLSTLPTGANGLTFTPDGTMLAVAAGNNILLYRASDGTLLQILAGHVGSVKAVAISPDGSTLASASADNTARTWSLTSFAVLHTFSGHTGSVNSVAFSPDGQAIVTGSDDKTSVLWRLSDGAILQSFSHTRAVQTAVVSKDGQQVMTGGTDHHLKIWSVATGNLYSDYTTETGSPMIVTTSFEYGVNSAVYSPDGRSIVYGRDDATVVFAANPLTALHVDSVTLNPSAVIGGTSVTGTVTLNNSAPAGGTTVSLASADPTIASLPVASVTVPAGAVSATFAVNTHPVPMTATVAISGSLNGSTQSAPLTVYLPGLIGLSVTPTSIRGGQTAAGKVTLGAPAPAGGMSVALSSNNANATVPAAVVVAEGATTGTFTVSSQPVAQQTSVTITAMLGTAAPQAVLTLTPLTVTKLSVNPASVKGSLPATGTVTLSDPAPVGGIVVTLFSSNGAVASPAASVTVAPGATTATFAITTHVVSASTAIILTGIFNGSNQTTVLTVTPPTVTSFTVTPTSIKGGLVPIGTVTLSDPAPAGGILVSLTSANPTVVSVPALVNVPAGSSSTSATLGASPVAADTTVVVTATLGASSATGTLTVLAPLVSGLAVNPGAVRSGQSATVTVTLDGRAPAGGTVVTLSSSNPAVAVVAPAITVLAGNTTVTTTVLTSTVAQDTQLSLTATLGTSSQSVNFTVQPVPITFYWRNDLSGKNNFWQLNGTTIVNLGAMLTVADLNWKIATAADLFHNGNTDLIWQNSATGDVVYWDVKDGVVVGSGYIQTVPDHNWKIVGSADLFHKGNTDLIWQNSSTGDVVYWDMNGAVVAGADYIKTVSDLNWKIFAVADLFHQGNYDLIWQNTSTGDVVYWDMSGATIAGSGYIKTLPDHNWRLAGSADLFHQSHTDLIWQNSTTGDVVYWDLTGADITGSGYIYTVPDLKWNLRAVR